MYWWGMHKVTCPFKEKHQQHSQNYHTNYPELAEPPSLKLQMVQSFSQTCVGCYSLDDVDMGKIRQRTARERFTDCCHSRGIWEWIQRNLYYSGRNCVTSLIAYELHRGTRLLSQTVILGGWERQAPPGTEVLFVQRGLELAWFNCP